jgi:soluble lytic murein transglycosylase-like protein
MGLILGFALYASSAAAQSDWNTAGGALFVGAEPSAPPGEFDALDEASPRPPFDDAINKAASHYGIDPKLLHALVAVESAFQPRAVSKAGAVGLTQLMPPTAAELGVVDPFDAEANLFGGADYLARQLMRFADLRLALAAFHAGPGRVEQLGRIPDITETQIYVETVVECFLALAAGRSVTSARDCRSEAVR